MSSIDRQSSIRKYIFPESGLWLFPIFCLQVIALAELLTNRREARTGLIIHGITLIVLLIHGALELKLSVVGENQPVDVFLVKEGQPFPCRNLRFWMNVV